MKNIKFLVFCLVGFLVFSCGERNNKYDKKKELPYNAKLGIGKYSSLSISAGIDSVLVETGDELYMQKCASCHDLSDKIIVGPGWDGVTTRRELVWLMNLMTNTEEMLKKDPELKKQIKKFKTQMPDFGLTENEARAILEFMRKNDKGEVERERVLPSACKHIGRN